MKESSECAFVLFGISNLLPLQISLDYPSSPACLGLLQMLLDHLETMLSSLRAVRLLVIERPKNIFLTTKISSSR